jgi:hypothetical protein
MHMLNGSATCKSDDVRPLDERCPFYRPETGKCRAAISGLQIEWRRSRNYCSTDDHDDCTVFLGKILRNSFPKSRLEALPFNMK